MKSYFFKAAATVLCVTAMVTGAQARGGHGPGGHGSAPGGGHGMGAGHQGIGHIGHVSNVGKETAHLAHQISQQQAVLAKLTKPVVFVTTTDGKVTGVAIGDPSPGKVAAAAHLAKAIAAEQGRMAAISQASQAPTNAKSVVSSTTAPTTPLGYGKLHGRIFSYGMYS